MQTTLVTRPIHESEIGNRTFFEVRDDPTGPLAEEYNDVLNAKMREGVSNLVRERFITFAVDAPDAEHAVPALARMRSMASGVLTGIRSDLSPLDGAERAGLLRSMLRPAEPPLPVDWSEVGRAPGHHDEGPRGTEPHRLRAAGGRLGLRRGRHRGSRVLAFRRFESNLSDRCLADMVDLPIPLVISTHVRALEQNKAIGFVKQRLNWIDKEVVEDRQMSAVKRGYDYTLLPAELRYTREEAQDMFERLKDDSQRLFRYCGVAMTYAPSREELEDRVGRLVSTAQANGIELAPLHYRQREGLNSALPLGTSEVDVERYMLTDEIAIQSPFATLELNEEGGGYSGETAATRSASSSPTAGGSRAAMGVVGERLPGGRQELPDQARDHEHQARVPGRRDHHPRPRPGVRPHHRGLRGAARPSLPRLGQPPQPDGDGGRLPARRSSSRRRRRPRRSSRCAVPPWPTATSARRTPSAPS